MNFKMLIVMLMIAVTAMSLGCGNDSKPAATDAPKQNVTDVKKPIFEKVGYYKDDQRNRSFCVYTDSKDTNEMIEFARKLQHTTGQQTVAHFFDDRKFTPDNSTQKTFESGMWLETPAFTKEYRAHMIGTYQKVLNGDESWWEKDASTRDDGESRTITMTK